jgi:hypothetical protein
MKVVVTAMPDCPEKCLFASYDAEYDVCECILSFNGGYECTDATKCPYLKAINTEEK